MKIFYCIVLARFFNFYWRKKNKGKISRRRQEKGNGKIKGEEQRKMVVGNGKLRDRGRGKRRQGNERKEQKIEEREDRGRRR